jgi:SnoaL-like domain
MHLAAVSRPRWAYMLAVVAFVGGLIVTGDSAAGPAELHARLDRLEIDVVRAEDIRAIKKLQRAYGYYADRGLWDDLADLFADDAVANYPSGGFDGNASIRAMFIQNLGQGKPGLAEGRIYNHTILQPVVDLAPDGTTATGRWRVLGMLGRFGTSASWADSLYRFDYVKQNGHWKIKTLIAYAGSGGGYDQGWTPPKPRPPGYIDTSPVRFNLAHPADRPWTDPCEADTSACVVPFPYSNRGRITRTANVSALLPPVAAVTTSNREDDRTADLIRRAQRLENEQDVLNLQDAYGYYLDRGLWKEAADLFASDGTLEVGQAGVYVGREHIRRSLALSGARGLRAGQLNDHLQIEPIVDVALDGRTAQARLFELAFVGGGGASGRIVQSVEEIEYVRRGGAWQIQSLHDYTILATDYDQGWAKSALPAPATNETLPPDRPPTVVYESYPKVYTPPLHFNNASTGRPTQYPVGTPIPPPSAVGNASSPAPPLGFGTLAVRIAAAERQVQRVSDYDEIENLQNAYGYYAEKSLWSDISSLFVNDGELDVDPTRIVGRNRILASLQASGPEGPVKGALNSQLQLQPVIHVAPDGRSAKIRSRLLQLMRDAHARPMWGSGIYENEVVKENGVWKFKRLHLYRTWAVYYKGGWASPSSDEGQLLPSRFTPPFHYRHPDGR